MKLVIQEGQSNHMSVDRSGRADPATKRQGFFVIFANGFEIEFEDEADAIEIAKAVLRRMGEVA